MKSERYDVIVLGAGAAGLICAYTAANRGRSVLLLEKSNKVGKKILMSGGGRCNFTNYIVEADNYICTNPHFTKSALNRYNQWDFIKLVEDHGIDYEERRHSQLFCKDSAKQILAMLLDECQAAGVEIETKCDVNKVSAETNPSRYILTLNQRTLSCQSLVIATGALSIPTLGGSGFGYEIASQFDLKLTERRAGLVPFMFSDTMKPICERLSGLALDVEVSCQGQYFHENMLFTHRGLSGPVMLQISNYWHPGDEITVNLLPGLDAAEWLLTLKDSNGKKLLRNLLLQKLSKSLVDELQNLWWPAQAELSLAEFTNKQLKAIGQKLNKWDLKPSATEGYRTAEVTLGGIDTTDISSKTMEAIRQPGLYFIGEVLDVSGHLGGFNFQWAWSSGYTAGCFV